MLFCSLFCSLFSVFCFVFSIPSSHIIVLSNHVTSNRIISCQIISHHNVTYIYLYICIYTYIRAYICKKKLLHVIKRTMLKSLFKTVRSVISTDHQLRLFHNFGAPKNKKICTSLKLCPAECNPGLSLLAPRFSRSKLFAHRMKPDRGLILIRGLRN